MAVKYVKDFSFPTSGGFHGDVQRYAKGGHVTKVPAKAKASAKDMPARAKPNAPAKGAPKMASKPAVGKRQGYDKGGRVPGREMDRLPTKRPPGRGKDLAPARPFRGKYEGYANGGPVDEILPGDGRGGLEAVPMPEPMDMPRNREMDRTYVKPIWETLGMTREQYLNQAGGPAAPTMPMKPMDNDGGRNDFLYELLQRDTQRMRGDAAQQMRDISALEAAPPVPLAGDDGKSINFLRPELQQTPIGTPMPRRGEDDFIVNLDSHYRLNPNLPPVGALTPIPEEPYGRRSSGPPPPQGMKVNPNYGKPGQDYYVFIDDAARQDALSAARAALPSQLSAADRMAGRRAAMAERAGMRQDMTRPRGLGGALMRARDKIASRMRTPTPVDRFSQPYMGLGEPIDPNKQYGTPRQNVLAPYMPSISATTPEESDAYFKSIGRTPSPGARFAKGGEVKGKKIGKVMREYKEGKLHSGSKKGPVVKSEKQAMAIALSEARKAGAKIPKKEDGGLMSYAESGSAGGSNVTFKEAFRKAREQGLKEFSWKGDRYSTKLKEETKSESKVEDKAPKAEMGRKSPESRGGKRNVTEMSEYKRERKMELPSDRSTSFRSEAEETGMSASERAEKARGYAENLMNVAGAGALLRAPLKAGAKTLARKASEFIGGRKMKKEAAETAARKSTPEYKEKAAQMEKFAEQMRARQKMGARYEEGGYASKGPKTRYTAAKGRRESKERAMERWAEQRQRHADAYAPGVDPDMKNRGGMPVHRRKPMYGGGKC